MRGCLSYETRTRKSLLKEKISICQALLLKNVDPSKIINFIIGFKGSTRLHYTRVYKEAKELLDNGADVNKKNGWGETPLHLAVVEGKGYPFIKLLLDYGADVNACSGLGRTPLHFALKRGTDADKKIIDLLLLYGADIDIGKFTFFLNCDCHISSTEKWYDRGDVVLIKSLIKTTLLYGFSDKYCEEIINIFCDEMVYCYEIGEFSVSCVEEVLQLRMERVNEKVNLTLFDIVTSEPEELELVPVKVEDYFSMKYPVYYDILKTTFRNYMRRVELFKLLESVEMVIFSGVSNKEISVDYYCLSMICENLVNNDFSNFLKALFDEETLCQRLELMNI